MNFIIPEELTLSERIKQIGIAQSKTLAKRIHKTNFSSGDYFFKLIRNWKLIEGEFPNNKFYELMGKSLIREAIISQLLEKAGIQVPHVYGLHLPARDADEAFLALENICISEARDLSKDKKQRASEIHKELIKKVIRLGYKPDDHFGMKNSGFLPSGEMVLYDFELWKAPTEVEARIESCFSI